MSITRTKPGFVKFVVASAREKVSVPAAKPRTAPQRIRASFEPRVISRLADYFRSYAPYRRYDDAVHGC